jgi:hypothetical protein
MNKVEPKYRKRLNKEQQEVLELLYRFRFGTSELIAKYFNKNKGMDVYRRMKILEDQGLIGKRFDSSYKIRGRPAAYYLLPTGAKTLAQYRGTKPSDFNINSLYKDKNEISEQFIDHNLSIFAIYNQLKTLYPDIKLFTKRQLTIYDYFPKPLPDAYMSLKVKGKTNRYFLELYEASIPSFVIDRRIRKLIDYYQDEIWQDKGSPFPAILCVAENSSIEKRLIKQIQRALYKTEAEMPLYTTSLKAILNKDRAIWSDVTEPDKLVALG